MIDIRALASSSKGNCYYINSGSSPLLLDPGIRFKDIQKELAYRIFDLAGALVSHEHQDHAKAVPELIKAGVDCYMSPGTTEMLTINSHRIHTVAPLQQFQLGPWIILPFDVQHDARGPLGFILQSGPRKILYATDTYYLRYRFQGLTHLLIECNYSKELLNRNVESGVVPITHKNRVIKSHMELETVKDFLRANDLSLVEAIYLIHLSDQNSDAEIFKREIQALTGKPVFIAGEKGGWS